MGKYFTIKELTRSTTATNKGIDNTPTQEVINNLNKLIDNLLDPIREAWGAPITVNSGYRSPKLNEAVKGAKNSQHLTGCAADITTEMVGSNKVLFDMIRTIDSPFNFDQLILEPNAKSASWIHISYSDKPRKQIVNL